MSDYSDHYYLSRSLCDVLQDMRTCKKTLNFSMLSSLIEEAQVMGNRMESALGDKKQLQGMHEKIQAAREELRVLKGELKEAGRVEEDKKGNSFRELFE
jgi:hypothetical protein